MSFALDCKILWVTFKILFKRTQEDYGTCERPHLSEYRKHLVKPGENLRCLYAKQYDVPVKVARLTQTTGAGLSKDDNRVIAQFARLAAKGQDIVLHTTGEAARPYCYTTDAITAILYILLKGEAGEAYNVANEDTYISAKGMAEFLRDNFNPSISVRVELNDNMGYAPVTKLKLSSQRLRSLGWCPKMGLKDIFRSLIYAFRGEN